MRVALLTSNFPPEFVGGTERVVASLAAALVEAGDEVVVLCGSDQPHAGLDVLREQHHGIEVARLPRRVEEPYDLDISRPRLLELALDEVRARRIDCVHLHHWSGLSSSFIRAARAASIPSVVTLHDLWTTCPRFFRRPPAGITCPTGAERDDCVPCVRRDLGHLDAATTLAHIRARDADLRAELDAAAAIVVPSEFARRRIAEHLPWTGPIEVVPHGLLEAVGDHEPESSPDGALRVGHFGNLVEDKGVLLLVRACAELPGLSLRLAGPFLEPAFGARVRALAAELGVKLECEGPYTNTEAHPARRLDVAVFPSLCAETYGLVVEEALARGVPVVVSDRGALAERIGGAGVVVGVDDERELAATLAGFVRDPSRLAALRAKLPRRFDSMHDAAMSYRALYARACEGIQT